MNSDLELFEIIVAKSGEEYQQAGLLFRKYAEELGIDLSFQGFEKELVELEDQYGAPDGGLLLIKNKKGQFIGCAGIRKLQDRTAELKRMYIDQEGRGLGLGSCLLKRSLELAKLLGYQRLRLDTLPFMKSAIMMYEKEGFYQIEAYRFNPIEGTKFYEKKIE